MCGSGSFETTTDGIKKEMSIYLGYYGCSLSLEAGNKYEIYGPSRTKPNKLKRQEMTSFIKENFTYDEIINLLLGVIDNGDEA